MTLFKADYKICACVNRSLLTWYDVCHYSQATESTVHASLTRLTTRVAQLESKADEAGTFDLVQQAKLKLL